MKRIVVLTGVVLAVAMAAVGLGRAERCDAAAEPSIARPFAIDSFSPAGAWMVPVGVRTGELLRGFEALVGIDTLKATGLDGSGIRVAVVGSGIDPGHRDLQVTLRTGGSKIAVWGDFTSEGFVSTQPFTSGGGWVDSGAERFRTGNIRSASGVLRLGFIRESGLWSDGAIQQDLNGNGLITDQYAVLLADPTQRGVYTRAYVDTNQNRDFTDEVPLGLYEDTHTFSRFRDKGSTAAGPSSVHFVVAGMARDGSWARLGFDSLGSGTFLAGLVGADGLEPGGQGIAPGCTLMALKVLDSRGRGSIDYYTEAILYAAKAGAHVVLVDWGDVDCTREDIISLGQLITDVVSRYNVIVLFPAGDNGPGLETCLTPGDSVSALTVGGSTGNGESLAVWSRSAIGPTPCNGWAPDILAPVSASSTVPEWLSRSGYALGMSTRVSAAHAAGCAAVLLQGCSGVAGADARTVMAALAMTGTPLAALESIAQGGGLIDAPRALMSIQSGFRSPMPVVAEELHRYREGGLFARDFLPGTVRCFIGNFSGVPGEVLFNEGPEWIRASQERLVMPAVGERSILFEYARLGYGLHSGVVRGTDPGSGSVTVLRQAVVNPLPLPAGSRIELETGKPLPPGGYIRHFVKVSPGITRFEVSAANSGEEEMHVQVVGPSGDRVYSESLAGRSAWKRQVDTPAAGTWEIVLFRDGGERVCLASLGVSAEGFNISVAAQPATADVGGPETVRVALANQWRNAQVRVDPAIEVDGGIRGEAIVVEPDSACNRRFVVPEGVSRLRIAVSQPSAAAGDVSLYLHQFEQSTGWKEIASSVPGPEGERGIDIQDPAGGSYALYVESGNPISETHCELSVQMFAPDPGVTLDGGGPAVLRRGDAIPLTLTLEGEAKNPHLTYLLVTDTSSGRLVSGIPLMVGSPEGVAWSVGIGGMAPEGKRYLTITRRPAPGTEDLSMMVDGRVYALEEGSATLAVPAPGEVEITILSGGYPLVSKTLVIEDLPSGPTKTPDLESDLEKERLRESLLHRLGL